MLQTYECRCDETDMHQWFNCDNKESHAFLDQFSSHLTKILEQMVLSSVGFSNVAD